MVTCPAADKVQIASISHLLDNRSHIGRAIQHVQDFARHLRLLVNFLEHEVGIAAFLHRLHRLRDNFRITNDGQAIFDRVQFHFIGRESDDLAVLQADDLSRQWQD